MTEEAEDNPEVEYELSLNEMTTILNGDIKTKGMKGYMTCVATHIKTGSKAYVVLKDGYPIYESQQAEAISVFLDLVKFDSECDKNDTKSSRKSNSRRPSGLRNRRS